MAEAKARKVALKSQKPVTAGTLKKTSAPSVQMYWLVYNVALEPDVKALVAEQGITAYTFWPEVHGAGRSGPHLNDDIWPGVNAVLMFVAPTEKAASLGAGVEAIRREFPGEGIKLIVQPCSAVY